MMLRRHLCPQWLVLVLFTGIAYCLEVQAFLSAALPRFAATKVSCSSGPRSNGLFQSVEPFSNCNKQGSKQPNDCSLHLVSLKWTRDDVSFSKSIKDTWRWKDSVLGDGRDFFVPKPETLTKLNNVFIQNVPNIQECAILSNCARFEVLLLWDQQGSECTDEHLSTEIRQAVSRCISAQVIHHQSRPINPFLDQFSRLDRPGMVTFDVHDKETDKDELGNELVDYWTHVKGVESVCRHLSTVAAGMALRPNRPERSVPFRPFSSRDAHVLLQLKRTGEVAQGSQVKTMLDFALRAGKAARDPHCVPQLAQLKVYGSDSKYAQEIPAEWSDAVAKSAMELAVEPVIAKCVSKFYAISIADAISSLRQGGEAMARTSKERTLVRKRLHQPTLDLREGLGTVEPAQVLLELQDELQAVRQNDQLVGKT